MPKKVLQPLQVYRLLPRTNCKVCGCPGCYAFAFELISRSRKPADCPDLLTEPFRDSLKSLEELFGKGEVVKGTDFVIDKGRCTGCGDCVTVCSRALTTVTFRSVVSQREPVPPVLQVVDGTVQIVNWPSCKRTLDQSDLCSICTEKCPFSALELVKSEEAEEEDN